MLIAPGEGTVTPPNLVDSGMNYSEEPSETSQIPDSGNFSSVRVNLLKCCGYAHGLSYWETLGKDFWFKTTTTGKKPSLAIDDFMIQSQII